jgi:predicted Rossmann fold flavoprotein
VKVSGGGRCNVTHAAFSPAALAGHYPRGQRPLKGIFHSFQASDTIRWFEKHGVWLKTEEDGRLFPETDDSQTIIDCFLEAASRLRIEIKSSCEVTRVGKENDAFRIITNEENYVSKKVLIAVGGYNKMESYRWLASMGLKIADPIPSLFTFNDSKKEFAELMGVAVPHGEVKIAGTRFSQAGAILITHWGLSGPAVIKLSAWAAEYLFEKQYNFTALVNWTGVPEQEIRAVIERLKQTGSQKQIVNHPQFEMPKRLWELLCKRAELVGKTWAEASNKGLNRLIESLFACPFDIKGKTTFKEEFVTCGGVSLEEIDWQTMRCKKIPGLYFAGEIINVDGETGGFNFQAAWSTAWIAANAIAAEMSL